MIPTLMQMVQKPGSEDEPYSLLFPQTQPPVRLFASLPRANLPNPFDFTFKI